MTVSVTDEQENVPLRNTELGFIPKDWDTKTLGDLCEFENGDRSSNYPSGKDFSSNGISFVNAGHVSRGRIDFSRMDFITHESYSRLTRGKVKTGDILYCLRGSLGKYGLVPEGFGQGAIASSLVIVRPKPTKLSREYLACYFGSRLCSQMIENWASGAAQPNLGVQDLARFLAPIPPSIDEQEAIGAALYDADALIDSLEQLLIKKRQIKQGAMQELLTGKRRLPGFSGEWIRCPLGEIANIKTGSMNNQDKVEGGEFPFFVRSQAVERIDLYTHDCEAILIPGEGGIGTIFHYFHGRFALHQRVYGITGFREDVLGRFLFFYMRVFFGPHAMENSVKATVDSLRLPTFLNFEVCRPPTTHEQAAIVEVLSDLEQETDAIESRLTKAYAIKQAMAQTLLTGRIRLVEDNA